MAARAMPGERVIGDRAVVAFADAHVLAAVADGLWPGWDRQRRSAPAAVPAYSTGSPCTPHARATAVITRPELTARVEQSSGSSPDGPEPRANTAPTPAVH